MSKSHPLLAVVVWCVACGSSFDAASDGSAGFTGNAGSTSDAGQPSSAGAESGGSAGQSGSAGSGGSSAGAAGSSAGSGGASAGAAGSSAGSGGSSGAADCAALRTDYEAAVAKARTCDKGSTDECSASSTVGPIGGCGCPVLVNAKSEYTAIAKNKYQAYQDAKCDHGLTCGIACLPVTNVQCASQPMTSGNSLVCTGNNAIAN